MQLRATQIKEWRSLYATLKNDPPGGWALLLAESYRHSVGRWRAEYGRYRRSANWARIRRAARKHAGGKCAMCDSRKGLECHHVTYARAGAERPEDIRVLCKSCHALQHASRYYTPAHAAMNDAQKQSARQRQADQRKGERVIRRPRIEPVEDAPRIRRRPLADVLARQHAASVDVRQQAVA